MPRSNPTPRCSKTIALIAFFAITLIAHAGGPRWYTGAPFYTAAPGNPVVFFTTSPLYYTDPGPLAASVSHAQADAMVAAAAATWNVPTSNLTLALGGTLAEHVSSANTYFDGTSVIFPDDVKLANYHAKPIAIIYDTDGSVIDTLLGSGASSPSGCRQNAVVEDVDGLDPAGTIDHAILILNGRCVGANADQLKQMQYQLMREFGRIIGLAWSQLNDNVFTGIPAPTAIQVLNWPIMHPIDVICGPYTYKCMAQPFTLRADDLSALAQLYPVTTASPGKTVSGDGALTLFGYVTFPTSQGMDAVNVVLRRTPAFVKQDPYEITSAVSGANHRQWYGNPVTGPAVGLAQSSGGVDNYQQGQYWMQRVPIVASAAGWDQLDITTEPINPLYSGDYAVGPYLGDPTAMSGTPVTTHDGLELAGREVGMNAEMADAPSSCNTGSDGVETAPVAPDPSGFWTGLLCSYQHSGWITATAKPGHTWTLEMTALNELGIGAGNKAQIVLGVWNAADPTGTLPTVTLTPSPFNAMVVGMTQLHMDATTAAQTYRIAISDLRGQGRPDFTYNARLLYADTISPAIVGASGGRITITGEGFRNGNVVTVNGVAATVISWTPNQIVFTAPTMHAANMTATGFADVSVVDATTGGTTVIQAALSYTGTAVDSITLVSAPATVTVGTQSSIPFSVRVISSDGTTPAPGATVQIVATGAATTFAACGAATCTLITDAGGMAQTYLTASAAGSITLTATEQSGGASVHAIVNAIAAPPPPPPPVRTVVSLTAPLYLAAGAPATWTVAILATQNSAPATGQTVAWTATSNATPATASTITDSTGKASLAVSTTGLAAGAQATIQGCVWTTVCATATAFGVDPSQWTVLIASGAGQSIRAAATLAPVVLRVTDLAGHAVQSATVNIYQTADAWQGICPPTGRCAAAPVLASSQKTLTTDAGGLVTVTPLEVANTPSVVHIAASTGSQGFVSLSLAKTP
jgi:IPT/TIG domain